MNLPTVSLQARSLPKVSGGGREYWRTLEKGGCLEEVVLGLLLGGHAHLTPDCSLCPVSSHSHATWSP